MKLGNMVWPSALIYANEIYQKTVLVTQ
jgi:hypothetical protein